MNRRRIIHVLTDQGQRKREGSDVLLFFFSKTKEGIL